MVNIYVGNLSYEANEEDIRAAFQAHGEVSSVQIIMDKMTGRSRGFGFVEMPDKAKGEAAIAALNLQEIKGRAITVNEAKPKGEGGGRGGFGGGGGGGGRGGYGGGGGGGRGRSW
jgi:RNA recognition motif-containing protein